MNYLEGYLNGEFEQVWWELVDLGPQVRAEPYLSQVTAVAGETMRRVSRNCEHLVSRHSALGYDFGIDPDRTGYFTEGAVVPATEAKLDGLAELEVRWIPYPSANKK